MRIIIMKLPSQKYRKAVAALINEVQVWGDKWRNSESGTLECAQYGYWYFSAVVELEDEYGIELSAADDNRENLELYKRLAAKRTAAKAAETLAEQHAAEDAPEETQETPEETAVVPEEYTFHAYGNSIRVAGFGLVDAMVEANRALLWANPMSKEGEWRDCGKDGIIWREMV